MVVVIRAVLALDLAKGGLRFAPESVGGSGYHLAHAGPGCFRTRQPT